LQFNQRQQKFMVIGVCGFLLLLFLLTFMFDVIGKMPHDHLEMVFGIIGISVSLIGIIVTLQKTPSKPFGKTNLCWAELGNAASNLATNIVKLKLNKQDIIFAIDAKMATIAETARNTLDIEIPIYVGTSYWISDLNDSVINNISSSFKTRKWSIYVSNDIFKFKQKKVLVVHDFAMSGDLMTKAKEFLIANGFKENNITTYCLVVTAAALNDRLVDKHWLKIDNTEFHFPWGPAR